MATTPKSDPKNADPSVATTKENDRLEHTQGGRTTRDDPADLGVPMLPGDGTEPVGPEDALGPGSKRGDYTGRIGDSNYQPHEVRPADPAAVADPNRPSVVVEAQRPRAQDIGDEAGRKGGVETTDR